MSKRILIIDDEQGICSLLDDFLRDEGYEITVAMTLQAAREELKKSSLPDLVLLDVMLPDGNGIEYLKEIRSHPHTKALSVIVISAHKTTVRDRISGLDIGADDYLVKPFDLKEMGSRIKSLLRRVQNNRAIPTSPGLPTRSGPGELESVLKNVIHKEVKAPPVAPPLPSVARHSTPKQSFWTQFKTLLLKPSDFFEHWIGEQNMALPFLLWGVFSVGLALQKGVDNSSIVMGIVFGVVVASISAVVVSIVAWLIQWMAGLKMIHLRFKTILSTLALGFGPLALASVLGFLYVVIGKGNAGEFTAGPLLLFPTQSTTSWFGFLLRHLDLYELWAIGLAWVGLIGVFKAAFKNKTLVLIMAVFLATSSLPAAQVASSSLALTLEDYVTLAMKQGSRVMTAYNNFENQTLGYKISYRQSRLPQLTASGSLNKSKSDLSSVITRREEASGSVSMAQPVYLSGANLSVSASETTTREEDVLGESHNFTKPAYQASLSQPLFLFTGNSAWRQWLQTKIGYRIAADQYRDELRGIENEARAKYYAVLLNKEQVEVERLKLESSRRARAIATALVKAGRYAGIELSRSDVKYQLDVRRLRNAEVSLQKAINDALEFASLPSQTKITFTSKLSYTPLKIALEKLIAYALQHSPDYLNARRRLELSELSLKTTLEENNPLLSATASVSKSESGDDTTRSETRAWSGGLNLTWKFFDSRLTYLSVQTARNSLENERISFEQLEKNIRTNIANAYLEVKRNEEQIEDIRRSRDEARRTVDVVRTRYKNGRDRLIDVFDSESDLRSLELEYLNALIAANQSKDSLSLLIGGLLDEAGQ